LLEDQLRHAVAFLGRYGHQPADVVLAMPITEIMLMTEEVGELLRRESDALASRMETDG
jgi:hypothetical protein